MLACERFAGRLPDPLELAGRDLIRACPPHPERPFPVLSATQQPGRSILPVPDPPDKGDQPCLPSPSRSTPARPPPEGRPPGQAWLIRLRRGNRSVITTIGLSRTSPQHLAHHITRLPPAP